MSFKRREMSWARRFAIGRLLLIGFVIVPLVAFGGRTNAAPGANWSRGFTEVAQGAPVTGPAPIQSEVVAGPWRLTVIEAVTGPRASDLVTSASGFNAAPADGFTYIAARIQATNEGSAAYHIDSDDFAVVGSSGLVRRFIGAIAPEPALNGTVAPGETRDGWIVGGARADDDGLILLYDSTSITGNWADAAFALSDGAGLSPAAGRAVELNRTGRTSSAPAGFNDPVSTREWVVELLEVVGGADIVALFPPSDYRTTALESSSPGTSASWIAFRVRITNNSLRDQPSHLSESAFTLSDGDGDGDGDPILDLLTLTPPTPDAAGEYFPGATREGWVVFDTEGNSGFLLRFLPHRTSDDPRFFNWGGGAPSTPREPSFTGTLESGITVVTTEDLVRMRDAPSTGGEIIEEMPRGTELIVTGEPQDGDGFTWYPVEDRETGDSGYVADLFIEPAD